jgi:hypothetical protein
MSASTMTVSGARMPGAFGLLGDPNPSHFPGDLLVEVNARLDVWLLLRCGALVEGAMTRLQWGKKGHSAPRYLALYRQRACAFNPIVIRRHDTHLKEWRRLLDRCRITLGAGRPAPDGHSKPQHADGCQWVVA